MTKERLLVIAITVTLVADMGLLAYLVGTVLSAIPGGH